MQNIYGNNDPLMDLKNKKCYMVFTDDGNWHSAHDPDAIKPEQFGEGLTVIEYAKWPRFDMTYRIDFETGIITEEPLVMTEEQQFEDAMWDLRYRRDQKLKETDWTQIGDVPQALKEKYQAYRQELRDLPASVKTLSDAVNLTWPQEPQ